MNDRETDLDAPPKISPTSGRLLIRRLWWRLLSDRLPTRYRIRTARTVERWRLTRWAFLRRARVSDLAPWQKEALRMKKSAEYGR